MITPTVSRLSSVAYFIFKHEDDIYSYLHRDGTWHFAMSGDAYFATRKEADTFLEEYLSGEIVGSIWEGIM